MVRHMKSMIFPSRPFRVRDQSSRHILSAMGLDQLILGVRVHTAAGVVFLFDNVCKTPHAV